MIVHLIWILALGSTFGAVVHAQPRIPAFTLADCDTRLGGQGNVPDLGTIVVRIEPGLNATLNRLNLISADVTNALRYSVREPLLTAETHSQSTYVVFAEVPGRGFAARVDFAWDPVANSARILLIDRYSRERDESLAGRYAARAVVRGRVFTISRRALARTVERGASVRSIAEALDTPLAPPVAHLHNAAEKIWLLGGDRDQRVWGFHLSRFFGVLHVEEVYEPSAAEKIAYLARSEEVHDDAAENTVVLTDGVLAGRRLIFNPGMRAKLLHFGITKHMIVTAALAAPGLVRDSDQAPGRVRKWFAGRAGDAFLNVSTSQEIDGTLVVLSAVFCKENSVRLCAKLSARQRTLVQ